MKEQVKHPNERKMKCPVCGKDFVSIPTKRNAIPGDPSEVLEQHVCPNGHVYVTEVGSTEMLKHL